MTSSLIAKYRQIGTSTIGHLCDTGYLPHIKSIHLIKGTLAGIVRTVTLESDNTDVIKHALKESQPGEILCIDAQVLEHKACWGALRTCAAIYEKLAAVIVIGWATDSEQIAQLHFPVFAWGVSSLTTYHSNNACGENGADIVYQRDKANVTIRNGDIAILDNDGVFVLSEEQATMLSEACLKKEQEDANKFDLFLKAYKNNALDTLFK